MEQKSNEAAVCENPIGSPAVNETEIDLYEELTAFAQLAAEAQKRLASTPETLAVAAEETNEPGDPAQHATSFSSEQDEAELTPFVLVESAEHDYEKPIDSQPLEFTPNPFRINADVVDCASKTASAEESMELNTPSDFATSSSVIGDTPGDLVVREPFEDSSIDYVASPERIELITPSDFVVSSEHVESTASEFVVAPEPVEFDAHSVIGQETVEATPDEPVTGELTEPIPESPSDDSTEYSESNPVYADVYVRPSDPLGSLIGNYEYNGSLSKGVCLACGAASGADDLFCITCGVFIDEMSSGLPVKPTCPDCTQEISSEEIFCPWCGSTQPVN